MIQASKAHVVVLTDDGTNARMADGEDAVRIIKHARKAGLVPMGWGIDGDLLANMAGTGHLTHFANLPVVLAGECERGIALYCYSHNDVEG